MLGHTAASDSALSPDPTHAWAAQLVLPALANQVVVCSEELQQARQQAEKARADAAQAERQAEQMAANVDRVFARGLTCPQCNRTLQSLQAMCAHRSSKGHW